MRLVVEGELYDLQHPTVVGLTGNNEFGAVFNLSSHEGFGIGEDITALGLDLATGALGIVVLGTMTLHTARLEERIDLRLKVNFILSRGRERRHKESEEWSKENSFSHNSD